MNSSSEYKESAGQPWLIRGDDLKRDLQPPRMRHESSQSQISSHLSMEKAQADLGILKGMTKEVSPSSSREMRVMLKSNLSLSKHKESMMNLSLFEYGESTINLLSFKYEEIANRF